jgi:hypothetical protein
MVDRRLRGKAGTDAELDDRNPYSGIFGRVLA